MKLGEVSAVLRLLDRAALLRDKGHSVAGAVLEDKARALLRAEIVRMRSRNPPAGGIRVWRAPTP